MKPVLTLLLAASLMTPGLSPSFAQETGFAVRQTEVKKEPYSDAAAVGALPEKAQVRVLARQGGWMQIEAGAPPGTIAGWVRMLSIRMGVEQAGGDSGMKQLFNIARTGSSGTTVATGVRGLDKEQIQNAQPNPSELRKLATYAATKADAEQFAAGNPQLKPQPLDYFPAAPAAPQR
jgi:hypothetical protein